MTGAGTTLGNAGCNTTNGSHQPGATLSWTPISLDTVPSTLPSG
jgi:hypothetical protein